MAKNLFDTIAPLSPANKTAALVSGRGEHFEFGAKAHQVHSATPLPFREPSKHEYEQSQFVDLTGSKIGRLNVLGVAADIPTGGTGAKWVVRCVCGNYETRKSKFIKACLAGENPGNEEPMCAWCGKTRKLQLGIAGRAALERSEG
ncbi:hypothetical protein HRR99_03030 [Agrobacterium vaccinii]|uniref:hypothetical protein n=1 Tax=Agrobacterium vaccinii TaxID=2735528 RepID=UPI001E48B470|nr:hypothetical protein [Agrobacterium vaccinii]UHS60565.1 hypothetical protein HRR99_03030 [Agrobacterium vaccinii]